jgi:lysine-N-methylase
MEQEWESKLGVAPVVRTGRSWALNKREGGACVFLDEQNRCRIHAEFGEAAKPLACRIFPFSVRPTERGWQASLRFDCPSVTSSKGAPLSSHRDWLNRLVGELPEPIMDAGETVELARGLAAHQGEIDAIVRRVSLWLGDTQIPTLERCVGVAKLITLLSQARLKSVRGPRFADLLDILVQTIRGESISGISESTARQRGMLRQAVLAHAGHVSLAELRSGIRGRLTQRWRQLRTARRMLTGDGDAPPLPGIPTTVPFEQIEQVRPSVENTCRIEDLVGRYLTSRIEGASIFGAGYYGWSVLDGCAALCLSVAVSGWLARYLAAASGSHRIRFQDVATALGMVDRATTRLPALGTWTERNRIAYLLIDDGLARLLSAYPFVAPVSASTT